MGAVVVQGEEVLLAKRRNEPWKGWWSLPGGVVETGETLRDAVCRELREETGLEVEPIESVEIFESIGRGVDAAATFHYVVIDYVCRVSGGALAAGDDAEEVRWFHRGDLPPHLTSGAPAVIEKAFAALERDTLKP